MGVQIESMVQVGRKDHVQKPGFVGLQVSKLRQLSLVEYLAEMGPLVAEVAFNLEFFLRRTIL